MHSLNLMLLLKLMVYSLILIIYHFLMITNAENDS